MKFLEISVELRYKKVKNTLFYNFKIKSYNYDYRCKLFTIVNRLIKNRLNDIFGDTIDKIIGLSPKEFCEIEISPIGDKVKYSKIYGIGIVPDKKGYVVLDNKRYKLILVDTNNIHDFINADRVKILL